MFIQCLHFDLISSLHVMGGEWDRGWRSWIVEWCSSAAGSSFWLWNAYLSTAGFVSFTPCACEIVLWVHRRNVPTGERKHQLNVCMRRDHFFAYHLAQNSIQLCSDHRSARAGTRKIYRRKFLIFLVSLCFLFFSHHFGIANEFNDFFSFEFKRTA